MFLDRYYITGVIDCMEEDTAVIRTDDGQEILWQLDNLPPELKEGSVVKLFIKHSVNEEIGREEFAKSLLNEILAVPQQRNTVVTKP